MQKLYRFLEKKPSWFLRNVYIIFPPVKLFLEWLVYHHYWKTVILPEIIENDHIFEWFDRNEFEIVPFRLRTIQLVSDFPILVGKTSDERKQFIRQDYSTALTDVLSQSNLNIEEYLTMIVDVDRMLVVTKYEQYAADVFKIILQFHRYSELKNAFKSTMTWLIGVIVLGVFLIFGHLFFG